MTETKKEITETIFSGRKIQAIKLYREATGLGLAEAKSFIEELTAELREQAPEKFSAAEKSGCGSAVLFFLVLAGIILHIV